MPATYAQKQAPAQKKDTPTASSVFDNSPQNEGLQRKADMANNAAQREEAPRPNNTGMPDNLKSGIESLSGFSMDDVRVHYNSSKPATVQALAYTQGTDIHVAPGQEKHLPHEAWHVAQQMAGRVSPTTNINGMPVNDNAALEHEADVMGEKAVTQNKQTSDNKNISRNNGNVCQMLRIINGYEYLGTVSNDPTTTIPDGLNGLKTKYSLRLLKIIKNYIFITNQYKQILLNGGVEDYIIKNIFGYIKDHGQHAIQDVTEYLSQKSTQISSIEKLTREYCTSFEHFKHEFFAYIPNIPQNVFQRLSFEDILDDIWAGKNINGKVTQLGAILSESFNSRTSIGVTENIVILAHGGPGFYANVPPENLAQKLTYDLPQMYRGEIYLAGCKTAQRFGKITNQGFFFISYIEELYNHLIQLRPDLNNCSIKGTRNSSYIGYDFGFGSTSGPAIYVGVEGGYNGAGFHRRKDDKGHIVNGTTDF